MIVGIIGAGNMGSALARGWRGSSGGPSELLIADADSAKAEALAVATGAQAVQNREAADRADLVVLAVKPDLLAEVAREIAPKAVLSILAGTRIEHLTEAFPDTPTLRVMPNIAAEERAGLFCYAAGPGMEGDLLADTLALLGVLGSVVEVEEDRFEQATALMGCGPGFIALVHESLVDAGVAEGFDPLLARELVTDTLRGTAALLAANGGDSTALRERVTSPGGMTDAGIEALEEGRIRETFEAAVKAAVLKAAGIQ